MREVVWGGGGVQRKVMLCLQKGVWGQKGKGVGRVARRRGANVRGGVGKGAGVPVGKGGGVGFGGGGDRPRKKTRRFCVKGRSKKQVAASGEKKGGGGLRRKGGGVSESGGLLEKRRGWLKWFIRVEFWKGGGGVKKTLPVGAPGGG